MKTPANQNMPFSKWIRELRALAARNGVGWLIVEGAAYGEYYHDGLTPAECFDEAVDEARDLIS